jgi:hypothetical protein
MKCFPRAVCLQVAALLTSLSGVLAETPPRPFVAGEPGGTVAPIVIETLPDHGGKPMNWNELEKAVLLPSPSPAKPLIGAVHYLREAIIRMTGKTPAVEEGGAMSRGIVLMRLENAPPEIRNDEEILNALRNDGRDDYNAVEAYYLRSEPERVLVIANTWNGILAGVAALLESVGYETLGVGPNWTHGPDFTNRPLIFSVRESGRPGFYLRNLAVASGAHVGAGTLTRNVPLADPRDEPVEASLLRWRIGTRMEGRSMPVFPGHALTPLRQKVIEVMRETKNPDGFLIEKATIGPDASRPSASAANKGHFWINDDPPGSPGAGKFYSSSGTEWRENTYRESATDLSLPYVRELFFETMKTRAEEAFTKRPDEMFVFGCDPADGSGLGALAFAKNKNWYPEYLQAEGVEFGKPYPLHGVRGLDQPREIWDPAAASDTVFGFTNWLLREYDKWIDSLPEKERVTASGKSKKDLIACALLSYNYHDVPPNFTLDPRIRVMVAGFPKNRGAGKWKNFKTNEDIASAFRALLSRQPAADYQIFSNARFRDGTLAGIPGKSTLAPVVQTYYRSKYDAGFRAFTAETDLNFGKLGLFYYLSAKMLWNPTMTAEELDSLRDRWFQRAFGSAWEQMKAYYDFMSVENFKAGSQINFAKAVRLIDEADRILSAAKETDALRRLDDLKQFWYYYYLVASGQATPQSKALREFLWKGQMSYMTSMIMVQIVGFKQKDTIRLAPQLAGAEFQSGPAHYTREETQEWWKKILEFWPPISVSEFGEATLDDGTDASRVDHNDLVKVAEFRSEPRPNELYYNSSLEPALSFLTVAKGAGQEVGFILYWPSNPDFRYHRPASVSYGIDLWNPSDGQWEELVDEAMTSEDSQTREGPDGKPIQWVEVRYKAPEPGTYRFSVGRGGSNAHLLTLDVEDGGKQSAGEQGMTFHTAVRGLAQDPVWFYIPKGTKQLDFELPREGKADVCLHTGLPSSGMSLSRKIALEKAGFQSIPLGAGEDGSLAMLVSKGPLSVRDFYSVPFLWAKSPSALLVPRAIAKADKLTPEE